MNPPTDVLQRFVWDPVREIKVPAVFAFGVKWFDICRDIGLQLVAYYGPDADPVPEGDMEHWRLGFFRLSPSQLVVVSSQMGYAGPPNAVRTAVVRELVERYRNQ